jgi:hypothetical protein
LDNQDVFVSYLLNTHTHAWICMNKQCSVMIHIWKLSWVLERGISNLTFCLWGFLVSSPSHVNTRIMHDQFEICSCTPLVRYCWL